MTKSNEAFSKWSLIIVLFLGSFLGMFLWFLPSPLLTYIMEDMSIDLAQAGLLISAVPLMVGVAMFGASIIVDRFGNKKTLLIGIWLMAFSAIMTTFAPNYILMMCARLITGAAEGIILTCIFPAIYQIFNEKERPLAISLNIVFSNLAVFLLMAIAIPMLNILGSVKYIFGIVSACCFVMAFIWTLLLKKNKYITSEVSGETQKSSDGVGAGIKAAFKSKTVITVALCFILINFVIGAYNTYLPTALSETNFTPQTAALIASTITLCGLFASLFAGSLISKVGLRKPFLFGFPAAMLIGGICVLQFKSVALCAVMAGLFGIGSSGWSIVAQIIPMEVENTNPSLIAGATAIGSGMAQIISFFVPFVINALNNSFGGLTKAMMLCMASVAVALISVTFVKETGPRRKNKI